jgi:hypothetical protein
MPRVAFLAKRPSSSFTIKVGLHVSSRISPVGGGSAAEQVLHFYGEGLKLLQ